MRINACRREGMSLLLDTSTGRVKIQVCGADVVRVVYTRERSFGDRASLMIASRDLAAVPWTVEASPLAIRLRTERLQLSIARDTAAFTWMDLRGNVLTREPREGGKALNRTEVRKVRPGSGTVTAEQGADGARAVVRDAETHVERMAWQARLSFVWADGEALYGLGQHEEGILNYRGHEQYLYQQNMKVAMPVLLSTRGYGILVDAYSLITFHDDQFGSYLWVETTDELDYYFMYGPELDTVVSRYRQLTGTAPLLPRWAFGYVQSKERYKTQAELIEVAAEYRGRGIPLDAIVLDWMSWPPGQWGQKSLDPDRFPDPKELTRTLHAMGVRLMVSIWPFMSRGGGDHSEMMAAGCLLDNGGTYNAFEEKARRLYWTQAAEGLFSKGVDAWWCDCTEPFEGDWGGDCKPEPAVRLRLNTEAAKAFIDPQFINAYSLVHSKGLYEGQRQTATEKRVVNLTRSGYAGQQRYGTIVWSGDTPARWDILKREVAGGLNFCACGMPYWTADIGAFFVKSEERWFWRGDYPGGCEDEGYRELYVRWFQLGVFLPMFRSHGTDTPREVWRFGEPGTKTYDTLIRFDFLRYRLLPYIYSLAGRVTHEHYTMMRLLAFDFRTDPAAHDIADQFMFGPAFLVNPVTQAMYYGPASTALRGIAKSRPVYLPRGTVWHDFWTGRREEGGRTIQGRATLDRIPLYVRAGSIVPLGPKVQSTGESGDAALELRVYSGADGVFTIYEDAGDGYGYEQGAYAMTDLRWCERRGELLIGERRGAFPGMVRKRTFHVVWVRQGHGTGLDETRRPDATVVYDGRGLTIRRPQAGRALRKTRSRASKA